jgi:hypothetical protein
MDIVRKRGTPGGQGNAVAEYSSYLSRSCDWSYGADARANDIYAESAEENNKFGGYSDPNLHFDPPGTPGATNDPNAIANQNQAKPVKPPNPGTPVSRANAANWNKPGGGYDQWKAKDPEREKAAGQKPYPPIKKGN